MSTQNTIENNKLLAEFMGWEFGRYEHLPNKCYKGVFNSAEEMGQHLDQMRYDSDWNWLMEVVEKINNLHIKGSPEIRIGKFFTEVFFDGKFSVFHITKTVNKIQTVYFSCLEFIKWHNELQNNKPCLPPLEIKTRDRIATTTAHFIPKPSKYFLISGYWKDTKKEFNNYFVKELDETEDEYENIFFHGLSEKEIKSEIKAGEATTLDFVITSYEETTLNHKTA